MTTATIGYEPVYTWVKQVLGVVHPTVGRTIAWAVLCVVAAQRVTPAAVARALPHEQVGSGRSCLRRVRRWWQGPTLEQVEISPRLIQHALRVHGDSQPVVVAMDTTRVGPWEVWVEGIVVGVRTLPIGWAVIPYPWPEGRYRATTLALVAQLQAAFPSDVRWSLVAARGFPSAALFAQLRSGGTDFSVRLRLSDWVWVAGVYAKVMDHLAASRLRVGRRVAAMVGNGKPASPLGSGWAVVRAAVAPLRRISKIAGLSANAISGRIGTRSIANTSVVGVRRRLARRRNATRRLGWCSPPRRRRRTPFEPTPSEWRSRKPTGIGIIIGPCGPRPCRCLPRPGSAG